MHKPNAVFVALGCSVFTGSASAQLISAGVKGGVFLTEPGSYGSNESKRYTVGPSIEFRLPYRFAAEVDALYSRVGETFQYSFTSIAGQLPGETTSVISRTRGNRWEFPVIGKYYFRSDRNLWQPFVGTGYAFEAIWFHTTTTTSVLSSSPVTNAPLTYSNDFRSSVDIGATVVAGVRAKSGRLSVLPEVRYTRWPVNSSTRRNEVKFLLGITF
jgi:hypothetical protein